MGEAVSERELSDAEVFGGGELSDEDVFGAPAKPKRKSFALGLYKGVMKPLDNAALAMEAGANKIGIDTGAVNNLFRLPSAGQAEASHAQAIEASPNRPSTAGEITGNIFGTIPAVLATKNPFIGGGLSGAALTDKRDLGGVAGDTAMGAGIGWAGGKFLDAAADVIKPVIDPAVRRLHDAGVKLTPGMVKGVKAMVKEDKAMSRPIVGDTIRAARGATQETFNTAGVNKALSPLGVKVPSIVKPGNDSIDFAKKEIAQAYDLVIPNIAVKIDGQRFAQNVSAAGQNLKPAQRKQLVQIISNELGNGQLAGQPLKSAQGNLRRLAGKFRRSQDPNDQLLGEALSAADDELTSAMISQNPKYAPQLQKVNEAYRGYRIVADAAGRADDGLFNTGQLKQATRRGDFSKNKDQTARGEAFFQDFSNDARKVIPAKTPDSGTAGRVMAPNLFANFAGLGQRAGYVADDLYQSSRFIPRPAGADALASGVRRLKGPLAGGAVAASHRSGN